MSAELYISVVDASHPLMVNRCMKGTDLLEQFADKDGASYRRACNFARCFDEVLVFGSIPADAIIHTFEWEELKRAFPQAASVKVSRGARQFERYQKIVGKLSRHDPASLVSSGISLVHVLFDQAPDIKILHAQKASVIAFCSALAKWVNVTLNLGDVERSVVSHPSYVSRLVFLDDTGVDGLVSIMADITKCWRSLYDGHRLVGGVTGPDVSAEHRTNIIRDVKCTAMSLLDVLRQAQDILGMDPTPSLMLRCCSLIQLCSQRC